MKLPKPLLAAVLAGITLQTVESCTKKKDDTNPKKQEKERHNKNGHNKPDSTNFPFCCPACGMG